MVRSNDQLIRCLDGRVTLSLVDGQVEIKYQHLNPSTHFRELIDIARSIVLAGGTMSPVSTGLALPDSRLCFMT